MDIKLNNPALIKAIKFMHSIVENEDLEKHRESEQTVSELFGRNRNVSFTSSKVKDIPILWTRPKKPHSKKTVILYCHGGGYITGSAQYSKGTTAKLAESLLCDVISFDYKLAPENPCPSALNDAMKIWDYLMYCGYGAEDVIICGDSAGGNLALTLSLRIKDQGRMMPKALVLFSPWTDLTKSGESYESRAEIDPVLTEEYIDQAINYYVGDNMDQLTHPYVSPLFGDFKDFPPTLIQVGTNEILYSDSEMLKDVMERFNVNVKFEVYDGMWHVFQMTPFETAYEAMDNIAQFIIDLK